MRHPLIIEEMGRHTWAITNEAMDAILRAVEAGIGPEDRNAFHASEGSENIFAAASAAFEDQYNSGRKVGSVGVINVEGPIVPRANAMTSASGITSIDGLTADLAAMSADESINAIIMVYDSPGGATTGISELAAMIRAVEKPVTAYVYGMAASAAYWLASAADRIVSADTGIVGSIGTVMTVASSRDDGRIAIVSSQSPRKNADPTSEEGRASYQEVVDAMADVFIEAVAQGRGVSTGKVLESFGQGGMIGAKSAMERGMIDNVSTFSSFLSEQSALPKGSIGGNLERLEARSEKTNQVDNGCEAVVNLEKATDANEHKGDEAMTLKEFLAANPDAQKEHDEIVASACKASTDALRVELKTTADVAASDAYPATVRRLAVAVIAGERSSAALEGAMSVVEMKTEESRSVAAAIESAALPATPAQDKNNTISADGVIRNAADLQAAIERSRTR